MQVVWIEAAVTLLLVSAVFGTAVSSEAPKIADFGIGLALFVAELVAGNWTGAVLNPARALGPALVAWQWNAHAVYWIGPLIGAGVAGALWKAILLPRAYGGRTPPPPHPAREFVNGARATTPRSRPEVLPPPRFP